jgi:hypothetical protein
MYYAYVHCRPDNSVFYVGKGSVRRANTLVSKRNKYHQRIVSKYGADNILVGMVECSSEAISFELEKGLIKCLKAMGVKLTNMTEGGEGQSGVKQNKEWVKKRTEKNIGSTRSELTKNKIRDKHLGKKHSDDTKRKLSAIFKLRPLSPAFLKAQKERFGKRNPHAKPVLGVDPNGKKHLFDTRTQAAKYINGDVSKVSRAIKTGMKHKQWTFKEVE